MISKNVQAIERYALEHGLMNNVLCPTYIHKKSNSFLLALQVRLSVKNASEDANLSQVLLSYVRFDVTKGTRTFGFDVSQRLVYAAARQEPLFTGPSKSTVNMWWVLNAINFFKSHLASRDGNLADVFKSLDRTARPQAWKGQLTNGTRSLGRKWNGTYCMSLLS